MKYKKYHLDNYNLYVIPIKRYKTTDIFFEFTRKYEKGDKAKRNLVEYINNYGTLKYPSQFDYQMQQMPLYFPDIWTDYIKRGNYGFYSCYVRYLNTEYSKKNILDDILPFVHETLFRPFAVDAKYIKQYLNNAKKTLIIKHNNTWSDPRRRIERNSDKYFFLNHYNQDNVTVEQYQKCKISDIMNVMHKYLHDSCLNIYVCGDVIPDEVYKSFKNNFVTDNLEPHVIKDKDIVEIRPSVRHKVAKNKINDTIVNINYTCDELSEREEKVIGPIFSGVTDSFNSLFKVVREEKSLCYSISSNFNGYSHRYSVNCTTSNKNYNKAIKTIEEEINRIKRGNIEKQEIIDVVNEKIKKITNNSSYKSYLIKALMKKVDYDDELPEDMIKKYETVTREEVIAFANKLHLDSTYVSKGAKDE